jgi:hypothetical protein
MGTVHLKKVKMVPSDNPTYRLPPAEACARRGSTGTQKARAELRTRIEGMPPGTVLRVSLGGEDYDFSPLDEIIVSGVLADIATGRLADRFIVLEEVSPYTQQELGYVLSVRRRPAMAITAMDVDGVRHVVGGLGEKARGTLEWLRKRGSATATDLRKWAAIELTAANNRLADLHAMGLVRREAQEPIRGAREYVYSPVD